MTLKTTNLLVACAFVGCAVSSTSCSSSEDRDNLVGTWTLVNEKIYDPSGALIYNESPSNTPGQDGSEFIYFKGSGYASAYISFSTYEGQNSYSAGAAFLTASSLTLTPLSLASTKYTVQSLTEDAMTLSYTEEYDAEGDGTTATYTSTKQYKKTDLDLEKYISSGSISSSESTVTASNIINNWVITSVVCTGNTSGTQYLNQTYNVLNSWSGNDGYEYLKFSDKSYCGYVVGNGATYGAYYVQKFLNTYLFVTSKDDTAKLGIGIGKYKITTLTSTKLVLEYTETYSGEECTVIKSYAVPASSVSDYLGNLWN